MKIERTAIIICFLCLLLCGVNALLLISRKPPEAKSPARTTVQKSNFTNDSRESQRPRQPAPRSAVPPALSNTPAQAQGSKSGKAPLKDPAARMALKMAGTDAGAEVYWMSAI